MNSKTIYKLSPSNSTIKQTSNDHDISQYLCILKESMPVRESGSGFSSLGIKQKANGENELEHQLLTFASLPNTDFAICFLAWSRFLKVLKILKAWSDISLFELDKNISQFIFKKAGNHDMNAVRISGC